MAETSIHYRRRWYYALWVALLALCCGALALWETPAGTVQGPLQVTLRVGGAPDGTRVQAWAGPWGDWPGAAWTGQGGFCDQLLPAGGSATLPVVNLAIARRRLDLGYIPRGTWDLVMLRLTPPSGPPRYMALPCSQDIRNGLVRPRHRLLVEINCLFEKLAVDAASPNRVP